MKHICLFLILSLACMIAICENERTIRRLISEKLIVQDISSWRPKTIIVSPNGKRLAYLIKKSGKWMVVVDGRESGRYDAILDIEIIVDEKDPEGKPVVYKSIDDLSDKDIKVYVKRKSSLIFSPDSKQIAYSARLNKKWFVVVNSKKGEEFDEVGTPIFSSNGKRLAYRAKKNKRWFMVTDGMKGSQYKEISFLFFSPDSKTIAYKAKIKHEYSMVVNNKEELHYTNVCAPIFSPNGKRLAYVAQKGNKQLVVTDGIEGQEYKIVGTPIFSPDSQRLAYTALKKKGNKWVIVTNGIEGPEYRGMDTPIFSPDSQRVAYRALAYIPATTKSDVFKEPYKWKLVVDGNEGHPFKKIGSVIFSPDSQRVAYVAHVRTLFPKIAKWTAVIDEKRGNEYETISTPTFSQDSLHIAYTAGNGSSGWLIMDGEIREEYKTKHYYLGPCIFSPNFQRKASILFYAGKNKRAVMIDGKKGNWYNYVSNPIFDKNSERVFYIANKKNQWFMVINGEEGKEYDGIEGFTFSTDGNRIAYVARKNNKAFVMIDRDEGKKYDFILLPDVKGYGKQIVFENASSFYYLAGAGKIIYLVNEQIE